MSPLLGRCRHKHTMTINSRPLAGHKNGPLRHLGAMQIRRLECLNCKQRWTTYEVHEDALRAAAKALDTLTTIDKLLSGEIIKPGNGRKSKKPSPFLLVADKKTDKE